VQQQAVALQVPALPEQQVLWPLPCHRHHNLERELLLGLQVQRLRKKGVMKY